MPPPDSPMTSMAAISSWAFFMLACSAIACFIMFPPPRIEVSSIWSVAFLFRGPHRLRVQRCAKTVLHFAHRRVFLERAPRRIERLGRAPFTVLSRRFDRRRAVDKLEFDVPTEIFCERLREPFNLGRSTRHFR